MNPALETTISLLLCIGIGFLLKSKIKGKEQKKGIKTVILSVALPATIFVALLKVQFQITLFYLPLFALLINVALFFLVKGSMAWFGVQADSADGRTVNMLFPSLAPGLSCFPFIMEYGSEESLAFAALADVGNKVFVLIILYLVAMQWFFHRRPAGEVNSRKSKVVGLLISLVREPVNLVIVAALVLLYLGWNMESIPLFLQDPISRMSLLMTPLVLLFIGMSVRIDWQQFRLLGRILVFRSALGFLLSGLFLLFFPVNLVLALVIVAFPQSAASFWPYAHMSVINDSEKSQSEKTFQVDLALNFLALSLPFSTMIILGISIFPSISLVPQYLLGLSILLLLSLFIPVGLGYLRDRIAALDLLKEKVTE